MAKFDISTYSMYIKMSNQKHILVEGKYDKVFLSILIDELISKNKFKDSRIIDTLEIDTAEIIENKTTVLSNREKVELAASKLKQEINKFSGFCDREFRKYHFSDKIVDLKKTYKIKNNLLWTRGHSIENYFFDLNILRNSFRAITKCHNFNKAFEIFEHNFFFLLDLISSISIAFTSRPEFIKHTIALIDYDIFSITTKGIAINKLSFVNRLTKKNISKKAAEEFYQDIQDNLLVANNSNSKVLRWFIHSHLTIRMFRTFFAKCLFEIHHKSNDASTCKKYIQTNYLKTGEENFAIILAHEWVKDLNHIYPYELFENLDVSVN